MARPQWALEFIKLLFPRNPVHGRVTKLPGVAEWVERRFLEGDHLVALPRDQTIKVHKDVEDAEQMVLPSSLADHFIDQASHQWIMDFCICRRSMPCKHYPVDLGCLFLGEPVQEINPEWGRLVTKEEAKDHIRKCQEAGLIHFIGKSKLDTVWLGIGPGEKLLTICNCCPCCCITRGLSHAAPLLSEKLKRAPGVEVRVTDDCIGCGTCAAKVCFSDAIHIQEGRAVIADNCRGCGRCAETCPNDAIKITIDPERFMKENVEQISGVLEW